MPRYHEQFGRPLNADPGTRGVVESRTRGSSTKDHWVAFLGGITLIVVSALAGLYRGSLEWTDVLTAIVGFALLGMAAYDARPSSAPYRQANRARCTAPSALPANGKLRRRRTCQPRAGDLMQEGLELRADAAQLLAVHLGELLQDAVALRAKP